jgi:excinuclease ABC subunit A
VGKLRGKKPAKAIVAKPDAILSSIQVRGARVHNLKNIDVDLPHDRLVVLTGVSGSGKSSLAFDTIYAEGQRRYLECLSGYARQYVDQLERPDVDSIEGLPPTVAIDQRAGAANPRSTLGTVTEIYDYLRLLFAKVGRPHCPACGVPIHRQAPEQMVAQLMRLKEGQKVQLLAPLVRGRKGQHAEVFQAIRCAGLIRARVDGAMVEVTDQPPKLAKSHAHTIEAVVDRISIREGIRPRLAESVDLALKLSGGSVLTLTESPDGWSEQLLSIHLNCPNCDTGLPAIEPRTFSFNSPHGACPDCQGLGSRWAFQPELLVPDRARSWAEGAVVPWLLLSSAKDHDSHFAQVEDFLVRHRIDHAKPLGSWPSSVWSSFWSGENDGTFPGLAALFERAYEQIRAEDQQKALDVYREEVLCPACGGSRLRPEARAVRIEGRSIAELMLLPIEALLSFFESLHIEPSLAPVASPLVNEIAQRLRFLVDVGLSYLTLGRGSNTLSGGELQRSRLAAQLGSGLMGVCTILDEPTSGLHPRDTDRLIASLRGLLARGNSVLVVEHDASMIRAADWVVDLGPGAGPDGGSVVAAESPDKFQLFKDSITARYLAQGFQMPSGRPDRLATSPGWIRVRGATVHNLKRVDAQIPLAAMTCVTGVSGSGKSTLVHDVLARAIRRFLHRSGTAVDVRGEIVGLEAIDQFVEVDQSPIGRSPRSTPATATGVFDEVRRVFAMTREAKIRGYRASRFSFNAKGGRCEACRGLGERKVLMHFLPDPHVTCEVCSGKRFNRQTLEVRFKGKSIGDVMEMRVDESRTIFESVPRVMQGLDALHNVGLGYLTLGQSSTTLSGGEAQRIKLAAQLGRSTTGRALYILDEPTTGLHFADIERLLRILNELVDLGHTVVVIEHQIDVIASADWVIDLGPEGGDAGGRIVAMGPPTAIASNVESHTGRALRVEEPGIKTA